MTVSAENNTAAEATTELTAGPNPIVLSLPGFSLFRRVLSTGTAVHQSAFALADQAVASATNFLTGVIIARASTKEELGLYMLGFSLVAFLTDMQTSLIATPYMVYAPRLKGHAQTLYTGSTLIHQLIFCLLAALAVLCGAVATGYGIGPRALGPLLRALALVIALIMLRELVRRLCFARLTLKTVLLFDLCIAVIQVGGLLLLARLSLLSASRAYWVVGSACGVAVVAWLWSERATYDMRIGASIADLKTNWILGKWVFASGFVWAVSMNLYPWLLAAFHGVASTGVWATCLGVISIGNPVLLAIQNLVGPKISHIYAASGHKAMNRFVLRLTVLIGAPMLLLCLALFVWSNRLLVLLYGPLYGGNGLVVAILALNLLVGTVAFSFSRALFAVDRADMDFIVNFAALFIMLSLGLWLVRAFGPLGAAFGLLGANVATSAIRAKLFLKIPTLLYEEQAAAE